jgi:hypothetical protein
LTMTSMDAFGMAACVGAMTWRSAFGMASF